MAETTTTPIQPTAAATPAAGTTAATPAAGATPAAAGGTMYPSVDEVFEACGGNSPKENIIAGLPVVLKAMVEKGLTSKNQLVGWVATINAECNFKPIPEYGGPENAIREGYSGLIYGRGFIQLTHDYNYLAAGQAWGVGDAWVKNPDAVLEPDLAAKVMAWFWIDKEVREVCEEGDWLMTRKIVNGGTHGWDVYMATVEKGLQVFKQGAKADGVIQMPSSYGAGDADAGGGQSRTLTMAGMGQGDVLAHALSIHARDRQNTHECYITLDASADPKILDLDAQKTFELKGMDEKLNGTYTVDEVTFLPLANTIQAIVKARRPDPNAKSPQVFSHNAGGQTPGANHPGTPGSFTSVNGEVKLALPYKSQMDNALNPSGSCNATSMAMCLEFLGVKGTAGGQFEDEIYEWLQGTGEIPGTPTIMVQYMEKKGRKVKFAANITDDELRKHLDKGKPAIIHGTFTGPGHICAVSGYTSKGFLVHDPYGKFLGAQSSYDNNSSGEFNLHEYDTVVKNFWHEAGTNGSWLHLIE